MVKENYNFWSTDAQTKLKAVIYKPEGETIATVIIAHGIGEQICACQGEGEGEGA